MPRNLPMTAGAIANGRPASTIIMARPITGSALTMGKTGFFTRFTSKAAKWCGSPLAVMLAALAIIAWAVAGPFFGFSDVWQLTINTGTTIITFLMVFIIQNSQNRDAMAVQIKL